MEGIAAATVTVMTRDVEVIVTNGDSAGSYKIT